VPVSDDKGYSIYLCVDLKRIFMQQMLSLVTYDGFFVCEEMTNTLTYFP